MGRDSPGSDAGYGSFQSGNCFIPNNEIGYRWLTLTMFGYFEREFLNTVGMLGKKKIP